jgi:hypothetical protein
VLDELLLIRLPHYNLGYSLTADPGKKLEISPSSQIELSPPGIIPNSGWQRLSLSHAVERLARANEQLVLTDSGGSAEILCLVGYPVYGDLFER